MAFATSAACVLVVDDSLTSCIAIEKQLTRLGCRVFTAKDGAAALSQLQDTSFDLVLLDCFMPVMDGFTVARKIRQQERESGRRHLPVIAISGDTDDAHVQLCLECGMDGVLAKPLPLDGLEKILALWCGQTPGSIDVADLKAVDLPALFRSTSREDCALLMQAVNAGHVEAIKRLVHRMKGAALTMKADVMVATLKRIEATLMASPRSVSLLQEDMLVLIQQIDAL